jgi:hypothetical protein
MAAVLTLAMLFVFAGAATAWSLFVWLLVAIMFWVIALLAAAWERVARTFRRG